MDKRETTGFKQVFLLFLVYPIGFGARIEIREDEDGFPEILFKSGLKIVYLYYDEIDEFFKIIDEIQKL